MKILFILIVAACSTLPLYSQTGPIRIIADSVPTLNATRIRKQNTDTTKFIAQNSNPFALVAGGSKGIGYGIAEALALRKYNLILIARHAEPLINAKKKLESTYNVQVEILQYDLSKEVTASIVAKWCID